MLPVCRPRSGGASDSRSLSRTSIPPRVHSLRHMHHAQRHCLAARITGGHIWVTPPGSPAAMSDSTAQTSGFGLMLTQAGWSTIRDGLRMGKPARLTVHGAVDAVELQWNPDDAEVPEIRDRRAMSFEHGRNRTE